MGVRDDGRFPEYVPHDQVGAFSAYAGQGQQLVEIVRHVSAVVVPQHLHAGADIPGLAVAQAAGMDDFLDVLHGRARQGVHIRELFIQLFHDHVHPGVRALCRQAHAHQELPRLIVLQSAVCLGVFFLQSLNDFQSPLFLCHFVFFLFQVSSVIHFCLRRAAWHRLSAFFRIRRVLWMRGDGIGCCSL